MNLLDSLNGNDKSRRTVGIGVEYLEIIPKGTVFNSIDLHLLKTIIKLAQKYKIQCNISVNSNFMNCIKIDLEEYVLVHQNKDSKCKKMWGNQLDFLKDLCNNYSNLKIFAWIENLDKKMLLGENIEIEDSWIPEGGG